MKRSSPFLEMLRVARTAFTRWKRASRESRDWFCAASYNICTPSAPVIDNMYDNAFPGAFFQMRPSRRRNAINAIGRMSALRQNNLRHCAELPTHAVGKNNANAVFLL